MLQSLGILSAPFQNFPSRPTLSVPVEDDNVTTWTTTGTSTEGNYDMFGLAVDMVISVMRGEPCIGFHNARKIKNCRNFVMNISGNRNDEIVKYHWYESMKSFRNRTRLFNYSQIISIQVISHKVGDILDFHFGI